MAIQRPCKTIENDLGTEVENKPTGQQSGWRYFKELEFTAIGSQCRTE